MVPDGYLLFALLAEFVDASLQSLSLMVKIMSLIKPVFCSLFASPLFVLGGSITNLNSLCYLIGKWDPYFCSSCVVSRLIVLLRFCIFVRDSKEFCSVWFNFFSLYEIFISRSRNPLYLFNSYWNISAIYPILCMQSCRAF